METGRGAVRIIAEEWFGKEKLLRIVEKCRENNIQEIPGFRMMDAYLWTPTICQSMGVKYLQRSF